MKQFDLKAYMDVTPEIEDIINKINIMFHFLED